MSLRVASTDLRPRGMARRTVVCGGVAAALASPMGLLGGCASVPNAQASRASRAANYHLVDRMSWGATDDELDRMRALGADGYVAQQLEAGEPQLAYPLAQAQIDALTIQTRAMPDLLRELEANRKSADALATEDARKAAQQAYQQELTRLAREAASRHLLRALYSRRQLQEHLTWFWFNHFNVHQYKSNVRAMLGDYEEHALRPHALGPFRELLGAVAHHPAMLRYLDNDQNAASRLNENYARELLELHTLGVDGGYTQRDVQELARVLTGHGATLAEASAPPPKLKREYATLYVRDGAYEFNPARHDFGDKTLLGHTIRGRGAAELDEVLDLLAAHPSTARFVSRKLAQYLMADAPPQALIDEMARAFNGKRSGDIGACLRVLLRAPEFSAAEPGKFKDPMHFVVSAVRAAYADRPILNTVPMQNWLNRMGEGLYNRQTPDGYPLAAEFWSSSGQMATRFEIARTLGGGSAGLFKPENAMAPPQQREQPAFPQLARPIYYDVVRATLRAETREALDSAGSPQEWNTLYLASPDFMYR